MARVRQAEERREREKNIGTERRTRREEEELTLRGFRGGLRRSQRARGYCGTAPRCGLGPGRVRAEGRSSERAAVIRQSQTSASSVAALMPRPWRQ